MQHKTQTQDTYKRSVEYVGIAKPISLCNGYFCAFFFLL